MTRTEAMEKLHQWYSVYFDVQRFDDPSDYLALRCDFHVHSEKYVLVKKAKLWEADSNEFVFVFSVPHLTEEIYKSCEQLAYERGMEMIQPGPGHMYSYITAVFVCESCDDAARRALRRCRIYKSFRLAFWGWMDFHSCLVELDGERVSHNSSGRSAAQMLKSTLFKKKA